MVNWQSLMQLMRYGIVGVLTNVAGYALYLGITYLGVGAKVAMTALYCVGVCISFVGNRHWVFGRSDRMFATSIRYLAAYVIGYVVNYSILAVFVDHFGCAHAYVQAVSVVIVALFLFITFKLFVFPHADTVNGNVG